MIVYPAIDVRGGRVVRLYHGDPSQETVHGDDPVAMAERWKAAGASWLHVVNLDGTLGEAALALDTLRAVARIGLPVQFGGGLRTLDDAACALGDGAARVVLGTLVVQNPALAGEAVRRFGPEAVAVALDARDGWVVTHGWQKLSQWTPTDLGKRFAGDGVRHALYTDVARDGDLSGVNIEGTVKLARETGLAVIASGGVASLDDITGLRMAGNVAGVVIGKALYEHKFMLDDAIRIASTPL